MIDDSKIKILICCPHLSVYGGVANYYKVLKNYIEENNYHNIIFFEAGGNGGGFRSLLNFFCEPWFFLYALIANKGVNVVILNPSLLPKAIVRNAFFLLLARLFGKKVIVFWRGFNPQVAKMIKARYCYWFSKIFNQADISLVLAREFRKTLVGIGIKQPIYTTTTLIDRRYLDIDGLTAARDRFEIIFLSRLDRNKGIYETIEAFKILRQKYPKLSLAVVGGGGDYEQLVEKCGNESGITFYGYMGGKEKYRLLLTADVFVFPSYWEGMPNTVLEAMSCGLPVVTSLVGGLKDFFKDGVHGRVLHDRKPQTIAETISELFDNHVLRERISKYNKNFAIKHFSPEKKLKFLLDISQSLLNGDSQMIPEDWFVYEKNCLPLKNMR